MGRPTLMFADLCRSACVVILLPSPGGHIVLSWLSTPTKDAPMRSYGGHHACNSIWRLRLTYRAASTTTG